MAYVTRDHKRGGGRERKKERERKRESKSGGQKEEINRESKD